MIFDGNFACLSKGVPSTRLKSAIYITFIALGCSRPALIHFVCLGLIGLGSGFRVVGSGLGVGFGAPAPRHDFGVGRSALPVSVILG